MPDQININESDATLRQVSVAIYDPGGSVVTGIDETDVTIMVAKADETAFSASTATLTEITGGTEGGLYILEFPVGEVDTLGDLRFEIASGGTTIYTVLGYVNIVNPAAAAVWDEVLDAAAPANAQTAKEILNLIISGVVAECSNLDSDGGVVFRDTGDTKNRITGSVADGIRTITTLDGT